MRNIDTRKLSPQEQEEKRKTAITEIKAGKTQREVAEMLNVSDRAVRKWVKRFEEGESLESKKRGVKQGWRKINVPEVKEKLRHLAVNYELPYRLWSNEAVQALLLKEFNQSVSTSTMNRLLLDWKFRLPTLKESALDWQDQNALSWLENEYVEVQQRAKKEGLKIVWCTILTRKTYKDQRNVYLHGQKIDSYKWKRGVDDYNVVSVSDNKGKMGFMLFKGSWGDIKCMELERGLAERFGNRILLVGQKEFRPPFIKSGPYSVQPLYRFRVIRFPELSFNPKQTSDLGE